MFSVCLVTGFGSGTLTGELLLDMEARGRCYVNVQGSSVVIIQTIQESLRYWKLERDAWWLAVLRW